MPPSLGEGESQSGLASEERLVTAARVIGRLYSITPLSALQSTRLAIFQPRGFIDRSDGAVLVFSPAKNEITRSFYEFDRLPCALFAADDLGCAA
jgi:hypothetical protein